MFFVFIVELQVRRGCLAPIRRGEGSWPPLCVSFRPCTNSSGVEASTGTEELQTRSILIYTLAFIEAGISEFI